MIKLEYINKDDLLIQLENYKILFAYHSNKIENDQVNYHDTREIFENDRVVNYTGDLRTLMEIQNQKNCFQWMIDQIINKVPMTIIFIKKLHYELTQGTYDERRYLVNNERPGEFKKHDYVTGINEVGSSPENVQQDLEELLSELEEFEGKDVLTIAAYFHASFEMIHPFADGNGRVGRTLLNYYLMTHGIAPLIIYEQDRKLYYECLEAFDTQGDLEPLIEFIKYEQEKTWSKKKTKQVQLKSLIL